MIISTQYVCPVDHSVVGFSVCVSHWCRHLRDPFDADLAVDIIGPCPVDATVRDRDVFVDVPYGHVREPAVDEYVFSDAIVLRAPDVVLREICDVLVHIL
jgi:hypothetical protein